MEMIMNQHVMDSDVNGGEYFRKRFVQKVCSSLDADRSSPLYS